MVKTLHNVRVVHIYVLGWSDIALLPIFENGQIAADQVYTIQYVYEFNLKKIAMFGSARVNVFIFQKSQGAKK